MERLGYSSAFLSGFLTFFTPCIFPLIPAYLVYISGISLEELRDTEKQTFNLLPFFHTLAFCIGFSLVFIAMGASASAVGSFIFRYQRWFSRLAGIFLLFFVAYFLGWLRPNFILKDKRFHWQKRPTGFFGSMLIGAGFAAGWTPCVGPILAGILIYASTQATLSKGVILLSLYSCGLALPFLGISLSFASFLNYFYRFQKYLRKIEYLLAFILLLLAIFLLSR